MQILENTQSRKGQIIFAINVIATAMIFMLFWHVNYRISSYKAKALPPIIPMF
jgi:hypothetical protein